MTRLSVEQLDEKINKLVTEKKEKIKKQKQEEAKKEREKNAKKRKLESRVKYIVGGYVLSKSSDYVKKLVSEKSAEMRPADLDTLQKYLDLQKTTN